MSPHSAGAGGGEGFGLDGEHADSKALTIISPAQETVGVPTIQALPRAMPIAVTGAEFSSGAV